MYINRSKLRYKRGWGKKINLKYNTSFPLFECRDTNNCIDCNFFAEAKLNLDSIGGIWVKIISAVRNKGC